VLVLHQYLFCRIELAADVFKTSVEDDLLIQAGDDLLQSCVSKRSCMWHTGKLLVSHGTRKETEAKVRDAIGWDTLAMRLFMNSVQFLWLPACAFPTPEWQDHSSCQSAHVCVSAACYCLWSDSHLVLSFDCVVFIVLLAVVFVNLEKYCFILIKRCILYIYIYISFLIIKKSVSNSSENHFKILNTSLWNSNTRSTLKLDGNTRRNVKYFLLIKWGI